MLTVLLSLVFIVGFASVGHAQELPSLVITAERPVYTDFSSSIRNEIRNQTEIAVWMTRINVRTNLGVKLGHSERSYQVAATGVKTRG
ncbi:MAG: hypothetical protein CL797_05550 [Chromatiales bacterium]|nr:hypothetical protein [Chromatiales bacterium]